MKSYYEFKPTKSSRPGREFIPSEPGGKHSKFGFCRYLKKWVRRDSMLGINARFYNAEGDQTTIRLRVSKEGWDQLLKLTSESAWDNVLMTKDEIIEAGYDYEDHYDSDEADS